MQSPIRPAQRRASVFSLRQLFSPASANVPETVSESARSVALPLSQTTAALTDINGSNTSITTQPRTTNALPVLAPLVAAPIKSASSSASLQDSLVALTLANNASTQSRPARKPERKAEKKSLLVSLGHQPQAAKDPLQAQVEQVVQKYFEAGQEKKIDVATLNSALNNLLDGGVENLSNAALSISIVADSRYIKYVNLLTETKNNVVSMMRSEGLDPAFLFQSKSAAAAESAPVSETPSLEAAHVVDPIYAKFVKMLAMGVPRPAVEAKMRAEGLDVNMLNQNTAPVKETIAPATTNKIRLCEDPQYVKWFKMLKAGVPRVAVELKMQSEQVDVGILDRRDELVDAPPMKSDASVDDRIAANTHPLYSKWFKMMRMGVPKPGVLLKFAAENPSADASPLDGSPDALLPRPSDFQSDESADSKPQVDEIKAKMQIRLQDHPVLGKFFKMLKTGVPKAAIAAKMQAEKLDHLMLDRDPNEMIDEPEVDSPASSTSSSMIPLIEHNVYGKYFRMLKAGIPRSAVLVKMSSEQVDVAILDRSPTDLVEQSEPNAAEPDTKPDSHQNALAAVLLKRQQKELPKYRRKKMHWKLIGDEHVSSDSIWTRKEGDLDFVIDDREFNSLFVELIDYSTPVVAVTLPADSELANTNNDNSNTITSSIELSGAPTQKRAVREAKVKKITLIDGKRAQAVGIALARIKLPLPEVRLRIIAMDDTAFTTDQLRALFESLPTSEEVELISRYEGDVHFLAPPETYMRVMSDVVHIAAPRIQLMIFRQQFASRVVDCISAVSVMEKACDEILNSTKLRRVLRAILLVGDRMNCEQVFNFDENSTTGTSTPDGSGETKIAVVPQQSNKPSCSRGITLDSLAKAQNTKAFDRKTTVLEFVVAILLQQDPVSLDLTGDFPHRLLAARLQPENSDLDINQLNIGLKAAEHTVSKMNQTAEVIPEEATICEPDANNQVPPAVLEFLSQARSTVDSIRQRSSDLHEKFHRVLTYLSEDRKTKFSELFDLLGSFLNAFTQAKECSSKVREAEKKKQLAEKEIRDKQMAARREVEKVNAERRKRIIDVDAAAELERKRRTMADSVKRRADDDAMGKLRKNARKLAIISMATEQKERSLVYFADRAKWDAIERNERQEQVRLARQLYEQEQAAQISALQQFSSIWLPTAQQLLQSNQSRQLISRQCRDEQSRLVCMSIVRELILSTVQHCENKQIDWKVVFTSAQMEWQDLHDNRERTLAENDRIMRRKLQSQTLIDMELERQTFNDQFLLAQEETQFFRLQNKLDVDELLESERQVRLEENEMFESEERYARMLSWEMAVELEQTEREDREMDAEFADHQNRQNRLKQIEWAVNAIALEQQHRISAFERSPDTRTSLFRERPDVRSEFEFVRKARAERIARELFEWIESDAKAARQRRQEAGQLALQLMDQEQERRVEAARQWELQEFSAYRLQMQTAHIRKQTNVNNAESERQRQLAELRRRGEQELAGIRLAERQARQCANVLIEQERSHLVDLNIRQVRMLMEQECQQRSDRIKQLTECAEIERDSRFAKLRDQLLLEQQSEQHHRLETIKAIKIAVDAEQQQRIEVARLSDINQLEMERSERQCAAVLTRQLCELERAELVNADKTTRDLQEQTDLAQSHQRMCEALVQIEAERSMRMAARNAELTAEFERIKAERESSIKVLQVECDVERDRRVQQFMIIEQAEQAQSMSSRQLAISNVVSQMEIERSRRIQQAADDTARQVQQEAEQYHQSRIVVCQLCDQEHVRQIEARRVEALQEVELDKQRALQRRRDAVLAAEHERAWRLLHSHRAIAEFKKQRQDDIVMVTHAAESERAARLAFNADTPLIAHAQARIAATKVLNAIEDAERLSRLGISAI